MLLKVSSKYEKMPTHQWNYFSFKETYNAKIKGKKVNGNLIEYIVFEIENNVCIDSNEIDELGLKCESIKEIPLDINKKWF